MKENEEELRKVLMFCRMFAFILLFLNFYYYMYGLMREIGMTHGIIDHLMLTISKTGLFRTNMFSKFLFLIFYGVSLLAEKGKKSKDINKNIQFVYIAVGVFILLGNGIFVNMGSASLSATLYTFSSILGITLYSLGILNLLRLRKSVGDMDDIFNKKNESFPQDTVLRENEDSVNLPTKFFYQGKEQDGWVNIVNPYRASIVLGTPGSGKSFSIIEPTIRQHLAKNFAMYCYDFKFPTLSNVVYKNYLYNKRRGRIDSEFFVINFDDPSRSHRCNPLLPEMLTTVNDAHEISNTIMLNLNKSWANKQGDFFVESPKNFVAACLWFLRIYQGGKFCTFPHLLEFCCLPTNVIFSLLRARPELRNLITPFSNALENGAAEQLEGQISSALIPLTKLESKEMYWVMTGNDFMLDINNPENPKVVCVGNNPNRSDIYGVSLALYNSRIIKIVNRQGQRKLSLIIDELATIFFRGLDQLIATGRSNRIATLLGFQDFSQLKRDYGDKEATVIINTCGNLFSGQVLGDSAESLSKRFGRSMQKSTSISHSDSGTQISESARLETLVPSSVISQLSQGKFVGIVADNFGEEIDLKAFHATIQVDKEALKREKEMKDEIPIYYNFIDKSGLDRKEEVLERNYLQIKKEVKDLAKLELERMSNDPELARLIIQK